MCIRAGPQFILYLVFQIYFLVYLQYQDLVVPDSVFSAKLSLFLYEKVKHYKSVAADFCQ